MKIKFPAKKRRTSVVGRYNISVIIRGDQYSRPADGLGHLKARCRQVYQSGSGHLELSGMVISRSAARRGRITSGRRILLVSIMVEMNAENSCLEAIIKYPDRLDNVMPEDFPDNLPIYRLSRSLQKPYIARCSTPVSSPL